MDRALQTISGSKISGRNTLGSPTTMSSYPLIPRMVLEVNRSDNTQIASNSELLFENGELHVQSLVSYVKLKTVSHTFEGFVMACLLETEDMLEKINLHPHVFMQRVFTYKPAHVCILELCVLLSMLENYPKPTLKGVLSIVKRAKFIYSKHQCLDAAFLLHGIETIAATTINYFDLDKEGVCTLGPGLLLFKLHKAIESGSVESKGLLKPIFLNSFKMEGDGWSMYEDNSTFSNFNIFYLETIFTCHFGCAPVVSIYKNICLDGCPRQQIISQ
ncbi:hypothetical protein KM481_gp36 [Harp seal herpesvirus]|uniref:Uncharacterized protein n=1 Tax=phocid gammaherpesvirus 3 TaxID=2560643 RepID=A0A0R5Z696_9GAMA|nr:hypothetical protein KM481_gp36 [Harp seal herpesvirus]AJG42966.1 hypothetical protein [Harp seal herpesvirus]